MLVDNIFNTGTKFVVSDRCINTTYGPGTTGFVSYIEGRNLKYGNIVHFFASIIRRGRTGKERIEIGTFYAPVFELKDEEFVELFPPNEELNTNKTKNYIHIEKVDDQIHEITEMENMNFCGWALAHATFAYKLHVQANPIKSWPNDKNNPLNIIYSLFAKPVPSETVEKAKELCSSIDFRKDFVSSVQLIKSALRNRYLRYKLKTLDIEMAAVSRIVDIAIKKEKSELLKEVQKIEKAKSNKMELFGKYYQ